MWLFRPIRWEACSGTGQFVLRILAQQYAVKLLAGLCIGIFLSNVNDEPFPDMRLVEMIIIVLIMAPIIETLLFQTLTIELARWWKASRAIQFCVGMIPFALLHFVEGVGTGIAAGVVGGCYFSYSYLECRTVSWGHATKVTMLSHCLHNLVAVPIILML